VEDQQLAALGNVPLQRYQTSSLGQHYHFSVLDQVIALAHPVLLCSQSAHQMYCSQHHYLWRNSEDILRRREVCWQT
jgi:hypothetical protein